MLDPISLELPYAQPLLQHAICVAISLPVPWLRQAD